MPTIKIPEESDLRNAKKSDPLLLSPLWKNSSDKFDKEEEDDDGRELSRWAATRPLWIENEDFLREAQVNIIRLRF